MPSSRLLLLLPLSLLSLLVSVPFLLPWRFFPDVDFYFESSSLFIIMVFSLVILLAMSTLLTLSRVSITLLLFAVFLFLQGRLMELPYPTQNDRVVLTLVVLAIFASLLTSLTSQIERQIIAKWIMWGLVIGVILQAVVVVLQFSETAANFNGWIGFDSKKPGTVYGQMKQRNLLGHYLMWGVIAVTYLLAVGKVPKWIGVLMIVFLGGIMGLVDSRSIVSYPLGIAVVLIYARLFGGTNVNKITFYFTVSIIWVLLSQWLTPFALELLGIEANSGLTRLSENASANYRLKEWKKAWDIFLDNPWVGKGWGSFSYESFIRNEGVITVNDIQQAGIVSHCHNIILQILSETGAVGFIIIFSGLAWSIIPLLKSVNQNLSVALLSLLAISLCHSLLEYPLWYVYFLAPFIMFLALGQRLSLQDKTTISKPIKIGLTLIIIIGLFITGSSIYHYKTLARQFSMKAQRMVVTREQIYNLAPYMPLMGYDLDNVALTGQNPTQESVPSSIIATNSRLNSYRPAFSVANRHGLYLYRQGKTQAAKQWLEKVWKYYPMYIPVAQYYIYVASPLFEELEMPIYQYCLRYRPIYPKDITDCPPPPTSNKVPTMLQRPAD